MVELGIVGARNSGKTTVIEKLVRHLSDDGLLVATVKHTSHGHRFDTVGKDSYRHREAGAGLTVAVSDTEVAVFARPDTLDLTNVQELVEQQFDLWLVEGDRTADRPKVLVTRELDDFSKPLPSNIVVTIGPERLDGVTTHFDTDDIVGLGSFVTGTILGKHKEGRA
jgi:molybdopterin-guanine dinucleotide biosynthesis protein B